MTSDPYDNWFIVDLVHYVAISHVNILGRETRTFGVSELKRLYINSYLESLFLLVFELQKLKNKCYYLYKNYLEILKKLIMYFDW